MEKIAEVKEKFATGDMTELSELISLYGGDERSGGGEEADRGL